MAQMNLEELIETLVDAGSVELTDVHMDIGDMTLDIDPESGAQGAQVAMVQQMMLGISQNIQAPLAHLNALEQMLLGKRK